MTAFKPSQAPAIAQEGVTAGQAGLSRQTLALSGGLVIDPATKAIAPNISMSVNNVL